MLTEDSLHQVALARAIALAKSNGAALTLVDVIATEPGEIGRMLSEVSGARSDQIEEDVISYHRERMAQMVSIARANGVDVTEAVLQGMPFVEIIRMVLREGHDLVIKGGAPRSGGSVALRGGDMHLLRKCPCPVWILNEAEGATNAVVLAAVDPGVPGDVARESLDRAVLDLASVLAAAGGAALHVVHGWTLEVERALRDGQAVGRKIDVDAMVAAAGAQAQERLARTCASAEIKLPAQRAHLCKAPPGDAVVDIALEVGADTLVLGTAGRTGVSGFIMGNTAETILNRVQASILAVKPPGFESPVRLETR